MKIFGVFKRNKKGNAMIELIVVFVILLAFAMIVMFGSKIYDELNTDIQSDSDVATEAKKLVSDSKGNYETLFDSLFLFAFVMLWLFLIVSSWYADDHPIMFVFSIILMVFILFIGASLSNSYNEIADDPEMVGIVDSFPMSNLIIDNIVIVILLVSASIMVTLYGKGKA